MSHEVVLGDVHARLGQTPEALASQLIPAGEGGSPRIEVLQVSDVELRARLKDGGEPREVLQVVELHCAHSPSAYLALGLALGVVCRLPLEAALEHLLAEGEAEPLAGHLLGRLVGEREDPVVAPGLR